MKSLALLALAALVFASPAIIATPAQARTLAECQAAHSADYCAAAFGTGSLMSAGHVGRSCPTGEIIVTTGPDDEDWTCICVKHSI